MLPRELASRPRPAAPRARTSAMSRERAPALRARRARPRSRWNADLELALVLPAPADVERRPGSRAPGRGRAPSSVRERRARRARLEEAGRRARCREAAAGALSVSARRGAAPMISATKSSRAGLAWNSEKSCTPAGRLARKRSKRTNASSGCGVVAQRPQQRRHQLGQQLARADAAHGAVAAVMPAAHRRRDRARLAVAELRQVCERVRDRRRCR